MWTKNMKPDLGLLMAARTPDAKEYLFPNIQLYTVSRSDCGGYTTTFSMEFEGKPYAVTLDFTKSKLMALLALFPKDDRLRVSRQLQRHHSKVRLVELPEKRINVVAHLGQVTEGAYESFIPFDVVSVALPEGSAPTVGPSADKTMLAKCRDVLQQLSDAAQGKHTRELPDFGVAEAEHFVGQDSMVFGNVSVWAMKATPSREYSLSIQFENSGKDYRATLLLDEEMAKQLVSYLPPADRGEMLRALQGPISSESLLVFPPLTLTFVASFTAARKSVGTYSVPFRVTEMRMGDDPKVLLN